MYQRYKKINNQNKLLKMKMKTHNFNKIKMNKIHYKRTKYQIMKIYKSSIMNYKTNYKIMNNYIKINMIK